MTGDVALTGAGKLKAKGQKYIVHAVGPVWKGGNKNEGTLLRDCVKNCLSKNPKKFKSISIPAISSGIFGFPKEECAKIMIKTALEEIKSGRAEYLEYIRFTNFDEETVKIFSLEMEETMKKEPEAEKIQVDEQKGNNNKSGCIGCVLI